MDWVATIISGILGGVAGSAATILGRPLWLRLGGLGASIRLDRKPDHWVPVNLSRREYQLAKVVIESPEQIEQHMGHVQDFGPKQVGAPIVAPAGTIVQLRWIDRTHRSARVTLEGAGPIYVRAER